MLRKIAIALLFTFVTLPSFAEPSFTVDEITKTASVDNLDKVVEGCESGEGFFSIDGFQYSESGNTIDLIKFKSSDDKIFAIPTGFDKLSNADKQSVQKILKKGQLSFAKYAVCGSGGFMSLISLNVPLKK
ncbi:hypothetical protein [Xenorhabdus innexi]|uniref:Uncharacterized protein n=1 Tax=Xenorhabdus innexi TaxID=290109 RepID=A0A1N6MZG3_9GAMM|nr:hypothetical protein [Xenorhabdus innexi]PHM30033.1 hypothetical protein Xinn_03616 [Xenorhabdus innexi]SIP74159.1 exported hypothetical protein [Xenorhabdus innexi]